MGEIGNSISILGGGSWASALVKIFSDNKISVNWYLRDPEQVAHIREYRHNPKYLSSVNYNLDYVKASSDLKSVVEATNVLILAIPSAFLESSFKGVELKGIKDKYIFSAVKGIIPEFNAIPARWIHKSFGVAYENIGMISGPCHAEEVADEKLSYLTISCQNEDIAEELAEKMANRYLKTNISDDLFGTEISAILKNIYSIATGICAGLGYGDNFQSVLISNAIQEIEYFVDELSPIHRDVKSSAYLGDLLVTCYSKFSRNRTFGYYLGRGYSAKTAQLEMSMIAEGYYATKSIKAIMEKFEVQLPIVDAVYNIIYGNMPAKIEIRLLTDKLQ
jgi:glycerol-3-phosphate dehydrogenase (NAD(P)+)